MLDEIAPLKFFILLEYENGFSYSKCMENREAFY